MYYEYKIETLNYKLNNKLEDKTARRVIEYYPQDINAGADLSEYKTRPIKYPTITRKTKGYSALLTFLNYFSNRTNISFAYISTHGFLRQYVDGKTITNVRRLLVSCNVVDVYDEGYRPEKISYYTKEGDLIILYPCAKDLILYPENAKLLKKYLESLGIKPFDYDKKAEWETHKSKLKNVCIHSRLNISPKGLNKYDFSAIAREKLVEYYNKLWYKGKSITKQINKLQSKPERKMRYEANIHWGKKNISSIGFRAYSKVCSLSHSDREKYLKQNYLHLHYDVKSSVPRVAYLLNRGIWLDDDVDIYKTIYKKFCDLFGTKFDWNNDIRHAVKSLFMRIYFSPSSDFSSAHAIRTIKDNGFRFDSTLTESDVKRICNCFRLAITSILGNTYYDSEIFFHESNIYLSVEYTLLKKSYDTAVVYDSFYCNDSMNQKEFSAYIKDLIKKRALHYYKEFNEWKDTFFKKVA